MLARICSCLMSPLLDTLSAVFAGFIFLAENSVFLKDSNPGEEQSKEVDSEGRKSKF